MPLTPPLLPAEVEQLGALSFLLFDLPDQTSLDTFVQAAIDYADAWMAGHMGSNYNLQTPAWAPILQRRGQAMLALESLVDTLKSKKTFGTHFAYISEDSNAYESLIQNDWGQKAIQALDLWVTVEDVGRGFAMPLFLTSSPIPITSEENSGLEILSSQYEEELSFARGQVVPEIGTVRR